MGINDKFNRFKNAVLGTQSSDNNSVKKVIPNVIKDLNDKKENFVDNNKNPMKKKKQYIQTLETASMLAQEMFTKGMIKKDKINEQIEVIRGWSDGSVSSLAKKLLDKDNKIDDTIITQDKDNSTHSVQKKLKAGVIKEKQTFIIRLVKDNVYYDSDTHEYILKNDIRIKLKGECVDLKLLKAELYTGSFDQNNNPVLDEGVDVRVDSIDFEKDEAVARKGLKLSGYLSNHKFIKFTLYYSYNKPNVSTDVSPNVSIPSVDKVDLRTQEKFDKASKEAFRALADDVIKFKNEVEKKDSESKKYSSDNEVLKKIDNSKKLLEKFDFRFAKAKFQYLSAKKHMNHVDKSFLSGDDISNESEVVGATTEYLKKERILLILSKIMSSVYDKYMESAIEHISLGDVVTKFNGDKLINESFPDNLSDILFPDNDKATREFVNKCFTSKKRILTDKAGSFHRS